MRRIVLPFIALGLFGTAVRADSETVICMHSGGQTPCPANTTMRFDVDGLNARFGAATEEGIHAKMAAELCTFTEDGAQTQYAWNAAKIMSVTGGSHGTDAWLVRCIC